MNPEFCKSCHPVFELTCDQLLNHDGMCSCTVTDEHGGSITATWLNPSQLREKTLVERLRASAAPDQYGSPGEDLLLEAARRIEELESKLSSRRSLTEFLPKKPISEYVHP